MSEQSNTHQVQPRASRRQPTPSDGQMHGKFYLRSKFPRIDPDTNEVYYLISPTDPAHRDQEIKAIVKDGPTVKKDDIIKALNSQAFDVVDLHLTKPAGDDKWQIYRASPPPTEAQRRAYRTHTNEKGEPRRVEAFVWTEALDDQVDRFHQYRSFSAAAQALAKRMEEDSAPTIVRHETADRFRKEAARLFSGHLQASAAEIEEFIEEQFSADSPTSKADLSKLLHGRQDGQGCIERVYYSPDLAFEKQVDVGGLTDKRQAMSSLLNYCAQRAVATLIVHDITRSVEKSGRMMSPSEAAETELVDRRELYATNPLLNGDDGQQIRALEEVELAEIAAARLVRLALHASQATPAVETIDVTKCVDAGGSMVPDKVSCDILKVVAAKGPSSADFSVDPAGAASQVQRAVCEATVQRAETGKESILRGSSGIIWQQIEGGAIVPPFSLVDENRLVQTLAQMEVAGGKVAKEYVAPIVTRCAEFSTSLTDPVRFF